MADRARSRAWSRPSPAGSSTTPTRSRSARSATGSPRHLALRRRGGPRPGHRPRRPHRPRAARRPARGLDRPRRARDARDRRLGAAARHDGRRRRHRQDRPPPRHRAARCGHARPGAHAGGAGRRRVRRARRPARRRRAGWWSPRARARPSARSWPSRASGPATRPRRSPARRVAWTGDRPPVPDARHLLRPRPRRLRGARGRAARSARVRRGARGPGQRRAGGRAATAATCSCPSPPTPSSSSTSPARRIVVPRRPAVGTEAGADRRLHALPGVVRLDAPPAPPGQRRALGRARAALLLAPRHHAAAATARSTTRPTAAGRDGDARRRDGRGPRGRLRRAGRSGCATTRRVAVLTPRGRPFTDAVARELARRARPHAALRALRGLRRARARASWPTTRSASGPFVLAGGEVAAMAVIDAVGRRLPGALGNADEPRGRVVLRGAGRRPRAPPLHPARGVPRQRVPRRCCSPATTGRSPAGAPSGCCAPPP